MKTNHCNNHFKPIVKKPRRNYPAVTFMGIRRDPCGLYLVPYGNMDPIWLHVKDLPKSAAKVFVLNLL